jgi:serine/threonine-protein kinase
MDSTVAIKLLRDAPLSPARLQRFAAEQRTLARLSHPGIARIHDAGVLPDGTPFFVMEHIEGTRLTDWCREHASGPVERLTLFRAVCEAVQYAHGHAIVHRDLKPSNILVDENGAPKLLDFGIAKQLDGEANTADQTQTALRMMTPAYAAPEQLRGDPIGVHTDVHALGVILYELLTGRLPFDLGRSTPGAVERAILEQDPERPSAVVRRAAVGATPFGAALLTPGAWADLDVLCLTAMHKEPVRRYRTADALIRDIDNFLGGRPLEARPDTVGYRAGKFIRRKRRPVAVAALALVSVIALLTFYSIRLAHARDAAVAEAARTQRIQAFMLGLFEGGDASVAPADTLHVITLLERGLRDARLLDADAERQAELYATLGGIYQKLGEFERSDSLLQVALDRRRTLFAADHPDVLRSLVALGELRSDQARLDDAKSLIGEALAAGRGRLTDDHPLMLEASTALGHVLQEAGDYDEAIDILARTARTRAAAAPISRELSTTLTELANTRFYKGDYDAADSIMRIVLDMDRRLYGERHPLVADGLINLGAVQAQRGNYAAAERLYRDALPIMETYYGADHYQTASNLTMIGRVMLPQKRIDEAKPMLRRALAIQERVYGPNHPFVASTINELASTALMENDYAAAEAGFERMAEIYRKTYGEHHYLLGIALSNLASTYMGEERWTDAEPVFRQAIEIYSTALSPDHLNTGIARIKLGRTLAGERRWAEAEGELTAGYAIVSKQADRNVSWLVSARRNLIVVYDSLGRPADAARYRAELADTAAAAESGRRP